MQDFIKQLFLQEDYFNTEEFNEYMIDIGERHIVETWDEIQNQNPSEKTIKIFLVGLVEMGINYNNTGIKLFRILLENTKFKKDLITEVFKIFLDRTPFSHLEDEAWKNIFSDTELFPLLFFLKLKDVSLLGEFLSIMFYTNFFELEEKYEKNLQPILFDIFSTSGDDFIYEFEVLAHGNSYSKKRAKQCFTYLKDLFKNTNFGSIPKFNMIMTRLYKIMMFFDNTEIESNVKTEYISNDVLISLNRIEIKNRIGKVLYKGEAREKGKIYNDTIQKYISEVTNGNKKYDIIDGKKVLQPFTEEITQKLNYLQSLLQKSKQSGFIVFEDDEYSKYQRKDVLLTFIEIIKKYPNISKYNSLSQYMLTNMQTLIPPTRSHFLFHVYFTDTDKILYDLKKSSERGKKVYGNIIEYFDDDDIPKHQGLENGLIQTGWVRYHIFNDVVWINTIQSDITKILGMSDDKFDYPQLNTLYEVLISTIFREFLKYMNSKGIKKIIIPTGNTRKIIFGEASEGFNWAYDELPKIFGFDKNKMKDTNILDILKLNGLDKKMAVNLKKTYEEFIEYFNKLNVWTRGDLHEFKKHQKNNLLLEGVKKRSESRR